MARKVTQTAVEESVRNLGFAAQNADVLTQGRGSDVLRTLTPAQIDPLVTELRSGEAALRKLRKRLEALRDGADRDCARPGCERPVAGRPDARYCSTYCRVHAHRHPATSTP